MDVKLFSDQKPDMKRVMEIGNVLVKYQFGNVLHKNGLMRNLMGLYKSDKIQEDLEKTAPQRFRLVLEELGTTFVKFGQVLSTRPDLIGKDFADELVGLRDDVPSFGFLEVKKIVEEELEAPLEDLFSEFQESPIASASIAQVHSAMLKDGTKVAVKVQRPDLEEKVGKDVAIMHYIAKNADKRVKSLKYFNLKGIVDEFERAVKKEMDFVLEARNIERFRSDFKDDTTVYAPKVYWEYSTVRVLTMEFIEGIKINEILKSDNLARGRLIADIGTKCYFKQIFENGFFHADPHSGNLIILENNRLCFIDFGMMGHLDRDFVENLTELFLFTVDYDIKGIVNQMRYMKLISDETDTEQLKRDLIDLLDKYMGPDKTDIGGIITELSGPKILAKNKLKLPKDFVLLGRVLSIADDLGRGLDPNFNGLKAARPLINKIVNKRFNPLRLLDFQKTHLFELEHVLKDLPQTINNAFLRIEEGKVKVELELVGMDEFSDGLSKISNRVAMSIIVASLILGSSFIMLSDKGMPMPVIGYSEIGLVIFLISTLLAVFLFISIFRTKGI
jgi:ubiquinone biosynthesis protein